MLPIRGCKPKRFVDDEDHGTGSVRALTNDRDQEPKLLGWPRVGALSPVAGQRARTVTSASSARAFDVRRLPRRPIAVARCGGARRGLAQADPQGESAHPRHELQSHAADDDVRRNNPASGMSPAPARSSVKRPTFTAAGASPNSDASARARTIARSTASARSLAQQLFGIRQDRDPHLVATIGRGTRGSARDRSLSPALR